MDGLLLIDKPAGITSFDVIRALRRQIGIRKIGHAGTLDPLATGLMLLLVGKACKQAMLLSKLDKTYEARIKLGETSTTDDEEGAKTKVSEQQPSQDDVCRALAQLTGEISQVPSVYSAIKIDGREAYKRARAGEQVSMPARTVHIYANELRDYAYPYVCLRLRVSSGTYIRSVARDLGTLLETGAYLADLKRTEVGTYGLDGAVQLDAVQQASVGQYLRPVAEV